MSLDPLQAKHPSLSPYNFAGNNPIFYIDPDGKKIVVYYNGQSYQYTPGVKPAPGSPEVLNKVHEAVSYAMQSKTGAKIWNTIGNSDKTVGIRFKDATANDIHTNEFHPKVEGRKEADNDLGTIDWDYNSRVITSGGWQSEDGDGFQSGYLSPSTVLTHEGGHVYDMLEALSHGLNSKEWAQYRQDNDVNMGEDDKYGKLFFLLEHRFLMQCRALSEYTCIHLILV